MIFLTQQDFKQVIDLQILYKLIDYPVFEDPENPTEDELLELEAANDLLDMAELTAIQEATDLLNEKYLLAEDYEKTGQDRQKNLVLKTVDIALYHLHSVLNPKQIPDLRAKRYDDAIRWFMQITRGEITPSGLTPTEKNAGDEMLFSSNKKRDHYF